MTLTEEQVTAARAWLREQNLSGSQVLYHAVHLVAEYAAHCVAEKDAEIARLRNALGPFVNAIDVIIDFGPSIPPSEHGIISTGKKMVLTKQHFFDARAALQEAS